MPVAPHPLVAAAFDALEDVSPPWLLLRGRDDLREPAGDVDLLVDGHGIGEVRTALDRAGFLVRRTWARGTQNFFVGWHEQTGTWVNLHVMTVVAFGAPWYGLQLDVAAQVLQRRRVSDGAPLPDQDDAFWITMLHALLDKGGLSLKHRSELTALSSAATSDGLVAAALDTVVGPGWSQRLLTDWSQQDLPGLVRSGTRLQEHWAGRADARRLARRNRISLQGRKIVETFRPPGLTIALLAPDGAGKSSVAAALEDAFYLQTRSYYLGLEGGRFARSRPSRLPGGGLLRRLVHVWRVWIRARIDRARRRVVVFDRHPFDARLAPRSRATAGNRVRRTLLGRSLPAPDLVVVLDAPAEVLHARKAEHDPAILQADRERYRALAASLPRAAVVDATAPVEVVARRVVTLAFEQMRRRARR